MRMRGEMEVFGGGRIMETRQTRAEWRRPRCFGFVTDRHQPIYYFLLFSIIQDSI